LGLELLKVTVSGDHNAAHFDALGNLSILSRMCCTFSRREQQSKVIFWPKPTHYYIIRWLEKVHVFVVEVE
jgi:hypothetical protein